jgi:selenide,water dikinase
LTQEEVRLTFLASCAGCAGKAGIATLAQVLRPLTETFRAVDFPNLLLGLDGPDDAAVYRINDELALVLTVDFFAPVVDDPYTYGAVAAANAMSDVYAMGGEVLLALNVVGFPQDLPPAMLSEILRGGADKVAEAGGVIAGGHTIYDAEPKYGLCVMGTVHPDRVVTRVGARPGDALFLTKRLGIAIVLTAEKRGIAEPAHVRLAVDSMLALNRRASRVAVESGVRAMADVTGFSLMGHGVELARSSGVALRISAGRLPVLPGALEYARIGVDTGGGARNREALTEAVTIADDIDEAMTQVLFDPQTSGGLLVVLPVDGGVEFERRMAAAGIECWRIGEVVEGSGVKVEL